MTPGLGPTAKATRGMRAAMASGLVQHRQRHPGELIASHRQDLGSPQGPVLRYRERVTERHLCRRGCRRNAVHRVLSSCPDHQE
jgi:hypothetical protein